MPPVNGEFRGEFRGYGVGLATGGQFVKINVDPADFARAMAELQNIPKGITTAMSIAINKTTAKLRTQMSARIRERVNLKKSDIDPHLKITKARPVDNPSGSLVVVESRRLGLMAFGARQTKSGVSYRISKQGGGRGFIPSGFIKRLPSNNGEYLRVFVRDKDWTHREPRSRRGFRTKGKSGLPIASPMGISAWGTVVVGGLDDQAVIDARDILRYELDDAVRFLKLRAAGGIPTKGAA